MQDDNKTYRSNPMIDSQFLGTLANIQSVVARIQTFAINAKEKNNTLSHAISPDAEFYTRLLIMISEAVDHEIKRLRMNE